MKGLKNESKTIFDCSASDGYCCPHGCTGQERVYARSIWWEIPNVKPAFDEEHFLGGEITKKWNTFLCNYTHTYEVEVGLSSSGTEFRKPAVFKAVERVNKYVKKSYKSQHMTKEEAIRIMSHVLDCANIICLESDTAALEEAAGDANTAEEALALTILN